MTELASRRVLLALSLAISALLALALAAPSTASAAKLKHSGWVKRVDVSEYYSTPEKWFDGKRVKARGLEGRHRVDWLYSAHGVSMQGDGIGLDGRHYHINKIGSQGWVQKNGKPTTASRGFPEGPPYWRAVGWRNRKGGVTYPKLGGGWSNHRATRKISAKGITFAEGSSLRLQPWRTLATDPSYIPTGSWVWIPAYRHKPTNGWFRARDVGGAIRGKHVDAYRPPPAHEGGADYYPDQRVYVVLPGDRMPGSLPHPRVGAARGEIRPAAKAGLSRVSESVLRAAETLTEAAA